MVSEKLYQEIADKYFNVLSIIAHIDVRLEHEGISLEEIQKLVGDIVGPIKARISTPLVAGSA